MSKIKVSHRYERGTPFHSDLNERVYYSLERDKNRNCIYKERGRVDIHEDIQSYVNGCSLELQLARMKMLPAEQIITTLNRNQTFGCDLSNVPSDLMAYTTMIDKLKSDIPDFENLIKTMSITEIINTYVLPKVKPDNDNKEDPDHGNNE